MKKFQEKVGLTGKDGTAFDSDTREKANSILNNWNGGDSVKTCMQIGGCAVGKGYCGVKNANDYEENSNYKANCHTSQKCYSKA